MATLFTNIIYSNIPAHFVYKDKICVAFLTIEPQTEGHTLVVPKQELDHWVSLDDNILSHLLKIAKKIGLAQQKIWHPSRIGLKIEGYSIAHTHIHIWPTWSIKDFNTNKTKGLDVSDKNLKKIAKKLSMEINKLKNNNIF